MRLRRTTAALTVALAACSSQAGPTTTTTVATTTTTATTTTAATTTTTRPRVAINVTIEGHPDAEEVVDAFYSWIGDRSLPTPDAPIGLIDHVEVVEPATDLALPGALYTADVEGGRVGVATIGDDVVLLADEGSGWQVVGAHLAGFGLEPWYGPPVRHVLILGTDARPGEGQQLYRADSIHIVSSNLAARAGSIVGIPRDTLVTTSYGRDKFTHVNATSERHTDEMLDIARDLTGLPVEGYFITGFLGFTRLVDDFGGVIVDVPFAMAEELSQAYLSKGIQRLWGANALGFSRNRHINGGDFTRSYHQGVVMLAALNGVLERDVTTLPELVRILLARAWTDLSPGQVLTLAAVAFEIDPGNVGNVVLPGEIGLVSGASVVILDEVGTDAIFADVADGVIDEG
ncbi:MAG TPA: LCP family protein [Acidimicrobiia bacterium]|nr:LCP family protein [Acidimicrobiia bacterium]